MDSKVLAESNATLCYLSDFRVFRKVWSMPRRYIVPTHLDLVDTILTIGSLDLSARQLLLLLVGGSLGYDFWLQERHWDVWLFPLGIVLHWLPVVLICALTLALALVQIKGRWLDSWVLLWLSYMLSPHRYLWRTLRRDSFEMLGGVSETKPSSQETSSHATALLHTAQSHRQEEEDV